jgi:CheY-like chemotaxis protein
MSRKTILIVDDNPLNLKLTSVVLLSAGYQVRTAHDAEAALEMLDALHPDLILVDVQLPGLSGLELARRIKSNPATRDIVVVALTANAMRSDEQQARDAGCDGYISKPIDTRTLAQRVEEVLLAQTAPGTQVG